MAMTSRPIAVLDIECYRNYFLVMFSDVTKEKFVGFEMHEGMSLDVRAIKAVLRKYEVVTFNGNKYDKLILALALKGASCDDLKEASDDIIQNRMWPWDFERKYNVSMPEYMNHVDLMEPSPGTMISLKAFGARMHTRTLQDLPYPHDAILTDYMMKKVYWYCGIDLTVTKELRLAIKQQLELRVAMSAKYNMDLRSKSDAQIGEAVIKQGVERLRKAPVYTPTYKNGHTFKYDPPAYIQFQTKQMRDVLAMTERVDFLVDKSKKKKKKGASDAQSVTCAALDGYSVTLGGMEFTMGIGGMHSTEKNRYVLADKGHKLYDIDVKSFYPYVILSQGLYPAQMGPSFCPVYRDIVETRVRAKDAGDTVTADTMKIVINGSFGKFGSMYSKLFSPELLIQTTVTGQLALFMLIEALVLRGIAVVSANTDGIVVRCATEKQDLLEYEVAKWERRTTFEMEYTSYSAIYSKDVNNYVAVYDKPKVNKDGSFTYCKTKGVYAPTGLMKNPTASIALTAAVDYLVHSKAVERTITECVDLRQFISVKQVAGGGAQGGTTIRGPILDENGVQKVTSKGVPRVGNTGLEGGDYLGKVVRFYWSSWSPGPIRYITNGNKVGGSDGAKAVMVLPTDYAIPDDLDYDMYVDRAYKILASVGVGDAEPLDWELEDAA